MGRLARRIGGGETVTRDLPVAVVGLFQSKQLLVAFGDLVARGVDRGRASGIGPRNRPVIGRQVIALCFWGGLTQRPQEGPTGVLD